MIHIINNLILRGMFTEQNTCTTREGFYICKVSDELVGFGAEPLVSGGATFQIQLKSNIPSVLADFSDSLDVFLHARPTSPKT